MGMLSISHDLIVNNHCLVTQMLNWLSKECNAEFIGESSEVGMTVIRVEGEGIPINETKFEMLAFELVPGVIVFKID